MSIPMNYTEITRRHCLEILSLHEGVDIDQRSVTAQVQQLRPTATNEEVSDGLDWLRSYGFAERRQRPLGGNQWRITKEGMAAHATL